jgi:hypothetical protein
MNKAYLRQTGFKFRHSSVDEKEIAEEDDVSV